MSRTIFVEIAVKIASDVDPFETIENCDYTLDGEGILSHEIVGVVDDNERTIF